MLLISNIGRLATMDHALGEISDAALVIDGDQIVWCGSQALLPKLPISSRFDAKQCLVMPGLIDCHSHLIFAGTRAGEFARRMNGESYEAIMAAGGGIRNTVSATNHASDQELYDVAKARADKILQAGVTTLEVKSGYGLSLDGEIRILRILKKLGAEHDLGFHPTFLGAHVVPAKYHHQPDEYVDLVMGPMLDQVVQEELAIDCDVFCENKAFSVEQAEKILSRALSCGLGLRAHVQQLGHSGGVSLVERLPIKSISHADFLSQKDLTILAASNTVVEILPIAALFLRSEQRPPVKELVAQGVSLALASDFNPGSAMCHDLILAARLGVVYNGMSIEIASQAITNIAAKSLGRSDIGVIEAGKKADILITRVCNLDEFFYDWTTNPVRAVIKNGRLMTPTGTIHD